MLEISAERFVALGFRNLDMRVLVHDNGVYGFTRGQPSSVPSVGLETKSTPRRNVQYQVTPLVLASASGYTFVARG